MGIDGLNYQSKSDAVEAYLRSKIAEGEIQPGQRLQQDALAEQLGVSSTPVREALRRLEAEGLVVRIPHKGVTAREAHPEEAQEAYAIRALLESYAARLAATRVSKEDLDLLGSLHAAMTELQASGDVRAFSGVNDRWHMIICRAAGSRLLLRTVQDIWKVCPLGVVLAVPERSAASIHEHERILQALRSRDQGEAESAMSDHIKTGEQFLLRYLAANPSPTQREHRPLRSASSPAASVPRLGNAALPASLSV